MLLELLGERINIYIMLNVFNLNKVKLQFYFANEESVEIISYM